MRLAIILSLTLFAFTAQAAGRDKKANCSVQLIREASSSSIEISFDADSQEECDRARGPEVTTAYDGPAAPVEKPAPAKKAKR